MDDQSNELLRQLIDAQKEQTELLRIHVLPLWTRIRFSLLALFVLMTLMATGVGFTVLAVRTMKPSTPTGQPVFPWTVRLNPTIQATPDGTIQLSPTPPTPRMSVQ